MLIQCRAKIIGGISKLNYTYKRCYLRFSIAAKNIAWFEETRHFWRSCILVLTSCANTEFSSTIILGSNMKLNKTLLKHYLTLIGKGYALNQTQIVMRYSTLLLITESASQTNCRRTTYLEIFLPLPINPLVRYQF